MSDTEKAFKCIPLPQYNLWGTDRLASLVHSCASTQKCGEVFLVSAMDTGDTQVGEETLTTLYHKHREDYFGLTSDRFPLRINLIDTAQSLSIQVHPDSGITSPMGFKKGVNEFWLVLEATPNATIELGHTALNQEKIRQAIKEERLEEVLRYVSAAPGDHFFLNPGTVHAIGAGLLIYEVTYNVDFTYRLYDHNRIDPITQKKRQLHIEDALREIKFPQEFKVGKINLNDELNHYSEQILIDEKEVFTLKLWKIGHKQSIPNDTFYLCTVIQGEGIICGLSVKRFETLLIPKTTKVITIEGKMTLLAATYRQ